jgi:hypothetical protein
VKRLEVPIVPEEPGKHHNRAAVTARNAESVIYGVSEELAKFSER